MIPGSVDLQVFRSAVCVCVYVCVSVCVKCCTAWQAQTRNRLTVRKQVATVWKRNWQEEASAAHCEVKWAQRVQNGLSFMFDPAFVAAAVAEDIK